MRNLKGVDKMLPLASGLLEDEIFEKLEKYSNSITDKEYDDFCTDLIETKNTMLATKDNYAYRNLHSHRRALVANIILFFKKVIRRCIKFYVEPVCNQQTEFNNAAYEVVDKLIAENQLLKDKLNSIHLETGRLDEVSRSMQEQIHKLASFEEKTIKLEEKIQNQKAIYSYSQSGEDAVVRYVLKVQGIPAEQASYLDLGANHAKEISNTYWLYESGARGVLVEANPDLIPELLSERRGDFIENKAICSSENRAETISFYKLSGDGLSTVCTDTLSASLQENKDMRIDNVIEIETISMEEIINKYFPSAPTLVNVDVEGIELDILSDIDFDSWRPLLYIVETIPYHPYLFVNEKRNEIIDFMKSRGYAEYAFSGINSIFIDCSRISEE